MKKDYSEYTPTDYEKYKFIRYARNDVKLDLFHNYATVSPAEKCIRLEVDGGYEELTMKSELDEFAEFEKQKFHVRDHVPSPKEEKESEEFRLSHIEDNEAYLSMLKNKYDIDSSRYYGFLYSAYEDYKIEKEIPLNNVLSGAVIKIRYGEGILDFIYADFETPFKQAIKMPLAIEAFAEQYRKNNPDKVNKDPAPEKIYNQNQEIVQNYLAYTNTLIYTRDIFYSSLYTAICPPMFRQCNRASRPLKQYYSYLKALQEEYLELIEFCFDDEFYPSVLGHLMPSERFCLYKRLHNHPFNIGRYEIFRLRMNSMGGSKMPFGMSGEELTKRFSLNIKETDEHKKFAERHGLDVSDLITQTTLPTFINVSYEFGTVLEMLELELTKMLEIDMRFRKCKRCGKYFIMKGNYDTKYCDRIADDETRSCQELAAQENYKQKVADNAALPIYNKYYKRYAARVKVRQIKEDEFKKWKYAALIKRNECSDGLITPQEFTDWLEQCFPNRKKPTKKQ